jgi:hypothetical protein
MPVFDMVVGKSVKVLAMDGYWDFQECSDVRFVYRAGLAQDRCETSTNSSQGGPGCMVFTNSITPMVCIHHLLGETRAVTASVSDINLNTE